MSSNDQQPQVLGVSDHAVHLAQGRDQARREAGHGVSADDALAHALRATNTVMALLLSGQDVRKAAPLLGQRRVEGK